MYSLEQRQLAIDTYIKCKSLRATMSVYCIIELPKVAKQAVYDNAL